MHQIRSSFLVQKNVTILFLHKRADFCLQIILNSHPFYPDPHYCHHHPPQKSQNIGINCLVYISARGNTSDILLYLTLKDNSSHKSNHLRLIIPSLLVSKWDYYAASRQTEKLWKRVTAVLHSFQWHSVTLWHTVTH